MLVTFWLLLLTFWLLLVTFCLPFGHLLLTFWSPFAYLLVTFCLPFAYLSHSCHILPFQPILWNGFFPSEPAKPPPTALNLFQTEVKYGKFGLLLVTFCLPFANNNNNSIYIYIYIYILPFAYLSGSFDRRAPAGAPARRPGGLG